MIKYDNLASGMKLSTVSSKDVALKKVLVRTDFNVPLEKKGGKTVVADDNRIKQSLETIKLILENRGKAIVVSHLGRPKGKEVAELSLQPVVDRLRELLGEPVILAKNYQDASVLLQQHRVVVLENVRFNPLEKENSAEFAKELAELADVYVNEAFSTAHRKHTSVEAITKKLPSFAGLAFTQEVTALHNLMTEPKRPFVMIIGGKKISDKVEAVVNLTNVADAVLLGGGTANNFLKADGFEIYKSVVEEKTQAETKKKKVNYVKVAENLLEQTKQDKILKDGYIPLPKIIYPIDVVAATGIDQTKTEVIELVNGNHEHAQARNLMYLDIGPKTVKLFQDIILQAGTVFWNGPMGVFEKEQFANGTQEIARTVAKTGGTTVLGGGDTIAAIHQFDLADRFDYVSAAGGAALEFLAGKTLPGVKPLLKK